MNICKNPQTVTESLFKLPNQIFCRELSENVLEMIHLITIFPFDVIGAAIKHGVLFFS